MKPTSTTAANDGVAEAHAFGEHAGESREIDGLSSGRDQVEEQNQEPAESLDGLPSLVPHSSGVAGSPSECWKQRRRNTSPYQPH